jgi:hypothetical protein
MSNDDQKVHHLLYEGEVEVWVEDPDDPDDAGVTHLILRDGPNDLGNDLGDYLRWLFGPGRALPGSRCRLAKQLRIVIDDLEPDEQPERRTAEGDKPNLELAQLIKGTADVYRRATPKALAETRDQYQAVYRQAISRLRTAFLTAATFELLAAQAAHDAQVLDDGVAGRELRTIESVLAGCKREGCGTPILWLKHAGTLKSAPIDADPAPNGNIIIDLERGTYGVLSSDALDRARAGGEQLRLNHFVTCKNPPGGRRS